MSKEIRINQNEGKKKPHGCLTAILVIAAIGIIGSCAGGSSDKNTPTDAPAVVETPASIVEEDTSAVMTTAEVTTEDKSVPTEYKSALKKAEIYSDTMYMSKAGIYNQLTSEYGEKFSAEAAQYAIDNIVADWKDNALKKAKTYCDTMYMSKMGIYEQLISDYGELFTPEEAQYAVDNVDADWNKNALEKAKTYQDTMSMSPAAIHDQLVSEYGEKFTPEEADYAIANLN